MFEKWYFSLISFPNSLFLFIFIFPIIKFQDKSKFSQAIFAGVYEGGKRKERSSALQSAHRAYNTTRFPDALLHFVYALHEQGVQGKGKTI